jgi:hypothetical protein
MGTSHFRLRALCAAGDERELWADNVATQTQEATPGQGGAGKARAYLQAEHAVEYLISRVASKAWSDARPGTDSGRRGRSSGSTWMMGTDDGAVTVSASRGDDSESRGGRGCRGERVWRLDQLMVSHPGERALLFPLVAWPGLWRGLSGQAGGAGWGHAEPRYFRCPG